MKPKRITSLFGCAVLAALVTYGNACRAQESAGVPKNLGLGEPQHDDGATRRALVVGVKEYEQFKFNLTYPDKDAASVSKALREAGWLVQTMAMNDHLKPWTAKSIENAITGLAAEGGSNDTLLFYFSGHGYLDASQQLRLCAFKTNPSVGAPIDEQGLQLDVVRSTLASGKAKRLLMVLDCCRTPGGRGPNDPGPTETELCEAEGIGMLYGTAPGALCWEPSGLERDEDGVAIDNGRFTHYLLRGLSGEARLYDDGYLTFLELSKWVARKMNDVGSKLPPNQRQSPFTNWDGKADADVILRPIAKLEVAPSPVTPTAPPIGVPDPKLFEGIPEDGRDELGRFLRIRHLPTGIVLRLIPAGRFMMGQAPDELKGLETFEGFDASDELPRHEIEISKPFYLGETEVTLRQWRMFAQTGYRSEAERDGKGGRTFLKKENAWAWEDSVEANWKNPLPFCKFTPGENHPVTQVSWNDAMAFCSKYGFTLPTEAQWEYACRAGSAARFWWGDSVAAGMGKLNGVTNEKNEIGLSWKGPFPFLDGALFTSPVGAYEANDFGLKDMTGNVWEWCLDGYDAKAYANRGGKRTMDPLVPAAPAGRVVLRGGSWDGVPIFARAACRVNDAPDYRHGLVGFRVARTF